MYRGRVHFRTPMMWFLGFVMTFTIGGMTGVLMSIPAIDFQVHNTLFLVAHFHNMIIGGVVFGYFAGITYWFPKIFGFKLNERLGRYAFWCWVIGFCLAFIPLYILGLMGAARRLDHYDASMGWQGLFVVAGVGVLVIALGISFQVLQMIISVLQRKRNLDTTGDPLERPDTRVVHAVTGAVLQLCHHPRRSRPRCILGHEAIRRSAVPASPVSRYPAAQKLRDGNIYCRPQFRFRLLPDLAYLVAGCRGYRRRNYLPHHSTVGR